VKETWQLVQQHGLWWAYKGEPPPSEAFETHGRPRHLPILGPYASRVIAETLLGRNWIVAAPPLILKGASASRPSSDDGKPRCCTGDSQ
jgi:hypothetical protein